MELQHKVTTLQEKLEEQMVGALTSYTRVLLHPTLSLYNLSLSLSFSLSYILLHLTSV